MDITDKIIVSKSEIESLTRIEVWEDDSNDDFLPQSQGGLYVDFDKLKTILENSQAVNSEPFGYVDLEQAIRAFDYGYGAVYLFNPKELKAIEDYDPLYTTPQPAPDTVPRADYDKLLEALKQSMVAIDDWLNMFASEFCNEDRVKEAFERIKEKGTIGYIADVQEINRKAIAEAEGK